MAVDSKHLDAAAREMVGGGGTHRAESGDYYVGERQVSFVQDKGLIGRDEVEVGVPAPVTVSV